MVFKINNKSFMELREELAKREDQLLDNPRNFLLFCVSTIVLILVYYSATKNALLPTIVLGMLWIVFWSKSTKIGKTFLIIATTIGYSHEILGVYMGWFTYATGNFGLGVPIWIALGYGCIYWSIENFWTHAEKRHYFKQHLFKFIWIGSLLSMFLLDVFIFEISDIFIYNVIFIALLFFLFDRPKEQHLALTVAFFTGLEEVLGATLGAWTHPSLSLMKIIPPYIFFVWLILFVVHSLLKDRTIKKRELGISLSLLCVWVFYSFFV